MSQIERRVEPGDDILDFILPLCKQGYGTPSVVCCWGGIVKREVVYVHKYDKKKFIEFMPDRGYPSWGYLIDLDLDGTRGWIIPDFKMFKYSDGSTMGYFFDGFPP